MSQGLEDINSDKSPASSSFCSSDIVVFYVVPTTLLVVMLVDLLVMLVDLVMLVLLRLPALFEAYGSSSVLRHIGSAFGTVCLIGS